MELLEGSFDFFLSKVNKADAPKARATVEALRKKFPEATAEELVAKLIQRKCMRCGAIGAVTSSASIVPGFGSIASLTFGVAADMKLTWKYQTELILEIAEAMEVELSDSERRKIIMVISGLGAGGQKLAAATGKRIAEKASVNLAGKSMLKAIPIIGVAASAGTNMVSTYVIGERAAAYFKDGPEAMLSMEKLVGGFRKVEENRLVQWLSDTTTKSWQNLSVKKPQLKKIYQIPSKLLNQAKGIGSKVKEVGAGNLTSAKNSVKALIKRKAKDDQETDEEVVDVIV